jgi:hypothetical protein
MQDMKMKFSELQPDQILYSEGEIITKERSSFMNYKVTHDMLHIRGSEIRQAFEDISDRTNHSVVYEPETKQVEFYNTSRGVGRQLVLTYQERNGYLVPMMNDQDYKVNPMDCWTAYGYFQKLLETSLKNPVICFLGWVDPDSIEPLADYVDPL